MGKISLNTVSYNITGKSRRLGVGVKQDAAKSSSASLFYCHFTAKHLINCVLRKLLCSTFRFVRTDF